MDHRLKDGASYMKVVWLLDPELQHQALVHVPWPCQYQHHWYPNHPRLWSKNNFIMHNLFLIYSIYIYFATCQFGQLTKLHYTIRSNTCISQNLPISLGLIMGKRSFMGTCTSWPCSSCPSKTVDACVKEPYQLAVWTPVFVRHCNWRLILNNFMHI